MERRTFLQASAAGAVEAAAARPSVPPRYRVVSRYRPLAHPGMPGPWPGRVVRTHAGDCIDEQTDRVDAAVAAQMLDRGICALTGQADRAAAWRRLFVPDDVVGIKVNCSGHPRVVSSPEVVAEVVRNLMAVGIAAGRIWLYERFIDQLKEVNYGPHLPPGVQQLASNQIDGGAGHYDPHTYVEADFFGEDDTRSNLIRLVSERFTKIVNIANIKDHGASGATGCLKNIAYGSFSNVARSHEFGNGRSHTLSFIGTLAAVEPLRSRTVLQIVDGLRGVWHGGPFARTLRYVFYPKQIWLGSDPVALDRLLLDVVDDERRRRGAPSIFDRNPARLGTREERDADPRVEVLIREPGHVAFAARLGLGIADKRRIRVTDLHFMTALLLFAQLLFWDQGPETAAILAQAGIQKIAAPVERAAIWRQAGLTVVQMSAADLSGRVLLEPPGVDRQIAVASPTQRPWIVASGWQFRRQRAAHYRYELPAGVAALAAAEAHAFGADAILKIDPRDLADLGKMLRLLESVPPLPWPDAAQIALADDGSELVGEVMNLLSRRNLLWRPVAEKPAAPPLLTIRIGSAAYPAKAAKDPSAFAQRIRTRIGDNRRALRVYGSEAVLARLQVQPGKHARARLQLINYGGNVEEGIRIRILGAYPRGTVITDRTARGPTIDHLVAAGATELTVPPFAIYAAIDLER